MQCATVGCLLHSDVYRQHKMVNSFEQLLSNVFLPLFEATINPQQHLDIHKFLQFVSLSVCLSISLTFSLSVCLCVCVCVSLALPRRVGRILRYQVYETNLYRQMLRIFNKIYPPLIITASAMANWKEKTCIKRQKFHERSRVIF